MNAHSLYRFFGADDALLYVGRTVSPSRRWLEHSRTKEWWDDVTKVTRESFTSAADLTEAERTAIHDEKPRYNIRLNRPRLASTSPAPSNPEGDLPVRKLYGKATAARHLGISPRSLDRLVSEGRIESVTIGRRRLVPDAALDDYIERLRRAS